MRLGNLSQELEEQIEIQLNQTQKDQSRIIEEYKDSILHEPVLEKQKSDHSLSTKVSFFNQFQGTEMGVRRRFCIWLLARILISVLRILIENIQIIIRIIRISIISTIL